jgi:PKD repeat protein
MQSCGDSTTTWDFGDGHTFVGETPSHKYPVAGTYTVTATFQGKSSTMTVEVDKKKARPVRVKKVKHAK